MQHKVLELSAVGLKIKNFLMRLNYDKQCSAGCTERGPGYSCLAWPGSDGLITCIG